MIFLNQWLPGNARSAAVPDLCPTCSEVKIGAGGADAAGGADPRVRATRDVHKNALRSTLRREPRLRAADSRREVGRVRAVSYRPGHSSGYEASFVCSIAPG